MKLCLLILYFTAATEVCYPPLGCFTDDPPFSVPDYRPPYLPWDPQEVNPQFYLTADDVRDEFVDWRSVDNLALYDGRGRTTIVTSHGWTNHYHPDEDIETGIDGNTWQNIARNTFESAMDVNYIALNWEDGADPLGVDGYGQAVANTQVAGRAIAHLMNQLIEKFGYSASKLQCVGHSLDYFIILVVCGYAGKFAQSEYGWEMNRITGLDPAGPYFEETAQEVHLFRHDAAFVDIIHTDAGYYRRGFMGYDRPLGHADFYPNGGSQQPGCEMDNHSCSHQKAPYYWTDSITDRTTNCHMNPCFTKDDYDYGFCEGPCKNCNEMGFFAIKPPAPMSYASTIPNTEAPYCNNSSMRIRSVYTHRNPVLP